MATEDSAARLNRLVDQQEVRIANILRTAISALKDEIDLDELSLLIEQGRVNDAIDRLKFIAESLAEGVNTSFVTAGQDTAEFMRGADVGRIVFDQINLNAVAMMQRNRLDLIREFTDEQRRATSMALVSGVEGGTNPRAAARNFRDSIGLTARQWQTVANHRDDLARAHHDKDAATRALGRTLRDKRQDAAIRRAMRTGKPIPGDRIDQMIERYTARSIKHRSEVIGRTEALRSVHQGNEEAYRQAIAAGTIRPEQLDRTWRTRLDRRERRTHRFLNGVKAAWGEPWVTENGAIKYPGDPDAPAKETIQCRCAILTRIKQL